MALEEFVAVQMKEDHRQDEDDDEGSGEEKDDRQKARLVGGKLLQLNMLQLLRKLLQAVGKMLRMLRMVVWVFHSDLDAVKEDR